MTAIDFYMARRIFMVDMAVGVVRKYGKRCVSLATKRREKQRQRRGRRASLAWACARLRRAWRGAQRRVLWRAVRFGGAAGEIIAAARQRLAAFALLRAHCTAAAVRNCLEPPHLRAARFVPEHETGGQTSICYLRCCANIPSLLCERYRANMDKWTGTGIKQTRFLQHSGTRRDACFWRLVLRVVHRLATGSQAMTSAAAARMATTGTNRRAFRVLLSSILPFFHRRLLRTRRGAGPRLYRTWLVCRR